MRCLDRLRSLPVYLLCAAEQNFIHGRIFPVQYLSPRSHRNIRIRLDLYQWRWHRNIVTNRSCSFHNIHVFYSNESFGCIRDSGLVDPWHPLCPRHCCRRVFSARHGIYRFSLSWAKGRVIIIPWDGSSAYPSPVYALSLVFQIHLKIPVSAVIGFCILKAWGLRFLLLTYNPVPLDRFWMWFPLCNAFEFCLGIYIVQAGLYPKRE